MTYTPAINDVLSERERQQQVEGWTPEHDDHHAFGELALAAACYAVNGSSFREGASPPTWWPWSAEWWKPKDARRDLVRAAALLIAEIERLDRRSKP